MDEEPLMIDQTIFASLGFNLRHRISSSELIACSIFFNFIKFHFIHQDLSFNFGIVGDSFETSVPWDKCEKLCSNVKAVVRIECQNRGIQNFMISCRVTQSYDAGVCVYFYFGFSDPEKKLSDPVHIYREIENKARDEILAGGKLLIFVHCNSISS